MADDDKATNPILNAAIAKLVREGNFKDAVLLSYANDVAAAVGGDRGPLPNSARLKKIFYTAAVQLTEDIEKAVRHHAPEFFGSPLLSPAKAAAASNKKPGDNNQAVAPAVGAADVPNLIADTLLVQTYPGLQDAFAVAGIVSVQELGDLLYLKDPRLNRTDAGRYAEGYAFVRGDTEKYPFSNPIGRLVRMVLAERGVTEETLDAVIHRAISEPLVIAPLMEDTGRADPASVQDITPVTASVPRQDPPLSEHKQMAVEDEAAPVPPMGGAPQRRVISVDHSSDEILANLMNPGDLTRDILGKIKAADLFPDDPSLILNGMFGQDKRYRATALAMADIGILTGQDLTRLLREKHGKEFNSARSASFNYLSLKLSNYPFGNPVGACIARTLEAEGKDVSALNSETTDRRLLANTKFGKDERFKPIVVAMAQSGIKTLDQLAHVLHDEYELTPNSARVCAGRYMNMRMDPKKYPFNSFIGKRFFRILESRGKMTPEISEMGRVKQEPVYNRAADFSDLNLWHLTPGKQSALNRLMEKLRQDPMAESRLSSQASGTGVQDELSVTHLLDAIGEDDIPGAADDRRSVADVLEKMGCVTRRDDQFYLSQGFLRRFNDVVDWYVHYNKRQSSLKKAPEPPIDVPVMARPVEFQAKNLSALPLEEQDVIHDLVEKILGSVGVKDSITRDGSVPSRALQGLPARSFFSAASSQDQAARQTLTRLNVLSARTQGDLSRDFILGFREVLKWHKSQDPSKPTQAESSPSLTETFADAHAFDAERFNFPASSAGIRASPFSHYALDSRQRSPQKPCLPSREEALLLAKVILSLDETDGDITRPVRQLVGGSFNTNHILLHKLGVFEDAENFDLTNGFRQTFNAEREELVSWARDYTAYHQFLSQRSVADDQLPGQSPG